MKALFYITLICSVALLFLYFVLEIKWLFVAAILLVVLSGTIRQLNKNNIK